MAQNPTTVMNNPAGAQEWVSADDFFASDNETQGAPTGGNTFVPLSEFGIDTSSSSQTTAKPTLRQRMGLDPMPGSAGPNPASTPTQVDPVTGEADWFSRSGKDVVQPVQPNEAITNVGSGVGDQSFQELSYAGETVRRGTEGAVRGLAMVPDLLTMGFAPEIEGMETLSEWDKGIELRMSEAQKERYTLPDAADDAIEALYSGLGYEGGLVPKADTAFEKIVELGGENLGAAAGFGGIMKTLQAFGGLGSEALIAYKTKKALSVGPQTPKVMDAAQTGAMSVSSFMRAEALPGTLGALTGGAFWTAATTEEQREVFADLGNLVGSLSGTLMQLSPTMIAYKQAKRFRETMGKSDEFWAQHDKKILANLSRLVPEDQLPKVKQRMSDIRKIQTYIPEFKPSVGAILDTEDARHFQSVVDADNWDIASEQYRKNHDAVAKWIQDIADETDPTQKEVVANALKALRKESIFEADRLKTHIADLEAEIISVSNHGRSMHKVGKEVKDQLLNARKMYQEHVSTIYKGVDPEGITQFDATELKNVVNTVTVKGGVGKSINAKDEGYTYLTQTLPKDIDDLVGGPKKQTLASVFRMPEAPRTLSYMDLYNLRKDIGKEARRIERMETGSRVPQKLRAIISTLDDMVDNKVLDGGDKSIAERHFSAIEMYKEMYVPRFGKDAVTGSFLRVDGKDITNDKIAEFLWSTSRDDADSNLIYLREIFEENNLKLEDPLIFETAKRNVYSAIEDYAIRDLNRKVRAAVDGEKDASVVFNRWVRDNESRLRVFPEVKEMVDYMGKEISERSTQLTRYLDDVEDLTTNVIEKYAKIDADTLVRDMVSQTPLKIRDTYRDLFVRNGLLKDFDPEAVDLRDIDEMIAAIDNPIARRQASALRDAISENTVQYLIRKSMKTDGTGFDQKQLLSSLQGFDDYVKSPTLNLMLNPKNRKELDMIRKSTVYLEKELNPGTKPELDKITAFFKKFGVSVPSISSRLYAQQLGKVGPVYIMADSLMRIGRGVSTVRAKNIYKQVMYDLEGLEKIIDARVAAKAGDAAALEELQTLSLGVKGFLASSKKLLNTPELLRAAIVGFMDEHKLLRASQANQLLNEMDKEPDANYPEDDTGALGFYVETMRTNNPYQDFINSIDDGVDSTAFPEEEVALPTEEEAGVGEFVEPTPLAMEVPAGLEDGIYEDGNGMRIRVEGGKAYGM